MLTHGLLVPHPPAIIPAVGKEFVRKFEKTINAMLSLGMELKNSAIETIVIVTPHAEIRPDSFLIRVPKSPSFTGNMSAFGAPEVSVSFERDRLMTARIIETAASQGISVEPVDEEALDYGTTVPLYYLASGLPNIQIVSLSSSLSSAAEHVRMGELVREVTEKSDKKVAFVASAELAHKLFKHSPHGFSPKAQAWDTKLVADLREGDYESVLCQDPFDLDEVGTCGFGAIAMLLGLVQESLKNHEILSYENPGGIGCVVGVWKR